jgi:hypothetical protein
MLLIKGSLNTVLRLGNLMPFFALLQIHFSNAKKKKLIIFKQHILYKYL